MALTRMILVAAMAVVPAVALAHGEEEHAPLHVDPALDECSIRFDAGLTQDAYQRFAREFGSVSAFKPTSSPVSLGRGRFAIAIEQLGFSIEDHTSRWNDTFVHPDSEHDLGADQAFPKVRARVGVTDALDLGAFYTRSPKANYGWVGVEAKYEVFRQAQGAPVSVGLRGAWTKTLFVHDMKMNTGTAQVAVSRTLWNVFTPYVYGGSDVVVAQETSDRVDLKTETEVVPHVMTGAELRWWHVAIGAEVHVSDLTSYQVQIGALF